MGRYWKGPDPAHRGLFPRETIRRAGRTAFSRPDPATGRWLAGLLHLAFFLPRLAPGASAGEALTPLAAATDAKGDFAIPDGSLVMQAEFPGPSDLYLDDTDVAWHHIDRLDFAIMLADDAPAGTEALVFVKDRDDFWYQQLARPPLQPGRTNALSFCFSPDSSQWEPVGHYGQWHYRSRLDPASVGLRIFASNAWTGNWEVVALNGVFDPEPEPAPPEISRIEVPTQTISIREPFSLRFNLPDRYANPFDPANIEAWAEITPPGGSDPIRVDAFYYQNYFFQANPVQNRYIPQGRPHWRLRYSPTVAGEHHLVLHARDPHGAGHSEKISFIACDKSPGAPFIRVSQRDPRFFEGCDDSPFFPIGHNIRSPFDTRMNQQFPWRFRHDEGVRAYERYFRDMAAHGQNMVEIWLCNWSLGLEWTPSRPGYHGLGEYNLIHSWQLDRILELARQHGIYINLVLKNHGRLSGAVDPEWDDHPINKANGGYLEDPMDFFSDQRARSDYKRQLRYIVSRWGYSPHVFAWELWSEIDLVGLRHPRRGRRRVPPQADPQVHAWMSEMGDFLHQIDPNRRLRANHVAGNFQRQNADMASLEQQDFNPVNAYHSNDSPVFTANLLRQTANANLRYGKPVMVTEFGGSHMAGAGSFLKQALRIGIWSSTATGVAGTPLFWWWQFIEEENLYPLFASLNRYMAGVDRRDPEIKPASPRLSDREGRQVGQSEVDVSCLVSPRQGLVYLAVQPVFNRLAQGETDSPIEPRQGYSMRLQVGTNAQYRVTFWDIDQGKTKRQVELLSRDRRLDIELPPFTKDLAFRFSLLNDHEGP